MTDGIFYIVAFMAGALVAFLLSNYYAGKIIDLMRDVVRDKNRGKQQRVQTDGEVSEGK